MHDVQGLVFIVMGFLWLSGALHTLAKRVPGKGHKELLEEIRKLREEVQALRRENHDIILSFDSTLRHTERRLDHLEAEKLADSVITPLPQGEPQRVKLGR